MDALLDGPPDAAGASGPPSAPAAERASAWPPGGEPPLGRVWMRVWGRLVWEQPSWEQPWACSASVPPLIAACSSACGLGLRPHSQHSWRSPSSRTQPARTLRGAPPSGSPAAGPDYWSTWCCLLLACRAPLKMSVCVANRLHPQPTPPAEKGYAGNDDAQKNTNRPRRPDPRFRPPTRRMLRVSRRRIRWISNACQRDLRGHAQIHASYAGIHLSR